MTQLLSTFFQRFIFFGVLWSVSNLFPPAGFAQAVLEGKIVNEQNVPVEGASISLKPGGYQAVSDALGGFSLKIPAGDYRLSVSMIGFARLEKKIALRPGLNREADIQLSAVQQALPEVGVKGYRAMAGMGYLKEENDNALYAAKKTEAIILDSIDANTAQNNPRQILGRIPGANYSETEGGGFPSNGIGFRGLNPSQSTEVNVRQNGYNITADVYGYPETYYSPPLEAVERVELTRGGAGLQFGPQFGGVVNYILKSGSAARPFEYATQNTAGSFGTFNSFHSVGGQLGKLNYYGFAQFRNVAGWRPNSDYRQFTGFAKAVWQASPNLKIGLEYTALRNRIHMAGGLSDDQFQEDPRASYRARNWLQSPWNLLAATLDAQLSPSTRLSVKSVYNNSSRDLVWKNEEGGPESLDTVVAATGQYVPREVQREGFKSLTTEARLLAHYSIGGLAQTLAAGARVFYGRMRRQGGGRGTTGSDFDLQLLDPEYEYDLNFSTANLAPFFENTFRLSSKFSLTPGARFEWLRSTASGYMTDGGARVNSDRAQSRRFLLAGMGAQYAFSEKANLYANLSQTYKPADYAQQTPIGVSSKIDPHLKDSDGFTSDLGLRGAVQNWMIYDLGLFYLRYNNRIGIRPFSATDPTTYRTNIGDSRHWGFESYVEINLSKALFAHPSGSLRVFNSFSYTDARYVRVNGTTAADGVAIPANARAEFAPPIIDRMGVSFSTGVFSATFLWSHTDQSYGDATNIEKSDNPIRGVIPAYNVMDFSTTWKFGAYNVKAGVNNLADVQYFTKRTDEYPGPGIIPSVGRSFYIGFGGKF